jgi:hypothetical protein
MRFLEVILENSKLKEAKLYTAARKASKNPELGITIQNKAAYYVIRDCANITIHYLPHFIFGGYENPFLELNGKFAKADIQQFVKATETSPILKQLLDIILGRAGVETKLGPDNLSQNNNAFDVNDPYGDYGSHDEGGQVSVTTNTGDITETLCNLFGSK